MRRVLRRTRMQRDRVVTMDLDLLAPQPQRDRFGRYLIKPIGGGKPQAYTRATTVAETLDDRYNLELWKMRQVAVGLGRRPDLIARVASTDSDDKKTINALCQDAMSAADSGAAANMGTALHATFERIDKGELTADTAPEMFRERATAYTALIGESGVEMLPEWTERIHVLAAHKVAGMADNHVMFEGRRYIADKKTGAGVDYGAGGFAVQLACYARSETIYNPATDTHETMPEIDLERALIIHVPAVGGPCSLKWVDIAAGWEALSHAMWARGWRKRDNLIVPFEVSSALADKLAASLGGTMLEPTEAHAERTAWVIERIDTIKRDETATLDLVANWPEGVAPAKSIREGAAWTPDEIDRLKDVLTRVEARAEVPFGVLDPTLPVEEKAEVEPPTVTSIDRPDEGEQITDGEYEEVRTELGALTDPKWVQVWATQAGDARRSLNMATQRTRRRYLIAKAIVAWAPQCEADDDLARLGIATTLETDLDPTTTTGAYLGALTIDQAQRLASVAAALADGTATVSIQPDGAIALVA